MKEYCSCCHFGLTINQSNLNHEILQQVFRFSLSQTVPASSMCVCVCAQVVGGGVRKEGRAWAAPPAAAAGHLGDGGREAGAGKGADGQGERPAGCDGTAGASWEGEAGGPGAVPGQSSTGSHVTTHANTQPVMKVHKSRSACRSEKGRRWQFLSLPHSVAESQQGRLPSEPAHISLTCCLSLCCVADGDEKADRRHQQHEDVEAQGGRTRGSAEAHPAR